MNLTAGAASGLVNKKILHDFNDMQFTPIVSPY
jgi:hypothetical protein